MAPGRIIIGFAAAGLAVILSVFIYMKLNPPPQRPPHASYDQVFQYCASAFTANEAELAKLRKDSAYQRTLALKPGEYPIGDDGFIYVLGGGMFEILLPSQLQVVRKFRDVKVSSSSRNPNSIIGCTTEHLAQALKVYGIAVPSAQPASPNATRP
jgi:hypothetical protein